MNVCTYDDAIINDLRIITQDSRIHITPANNVFNLIGRLEDDVIEMPLISLTRTGWSLSDSKPHAAKFDGGLVSVDESGIKRVQVIPISINYQLDVWTKSREENDNILRELIFYYSTHPSLLINIDHNLNISHYFNIFIDSNIEDNSDIIEHKNRGEYFRQTLSIYTDDAYLWKSSISKPVLIDPEFSIEITNERGDIIDKNL